MTNKIHKINMTLLTCNQPYQHQQMVNRSVLLAQHRIAVT